MLRFFRARSCKSIRFLSGLQRASVALGMMLVTSLVVHAQPYSESKWTPSDPRAEQEFGAAVALDGAVALGGAFRDDDPVLDAGEAGAAYVLRYDGSTRGEEAKLIAPQRENLDWFGRSVAVNGGAFGTLSSAVDNAGTEFFIAFMPNSGEPRPVTTELHLTSDVATDVTVHYPVLAPTLSTTVAVSPGTITIVDLGPGPAEAWAPGAVGSNAVRAFSDNEFAVYAVNRQDLSTDATIALPVDALGTEYVVQSYPQHYRFSAFAVAAVYDGTTVTITPTQDLEGGYAAGVPFAVTLDRGEGFLGQSLGDSLASSDADLTGTLIESDRPVHLSNGNTCASVPTPFNSCDHLFEAAHPVQWWGREAVAAPLPLRPSGSFYRVLAAEDGTTVQHNGVTVATLSRGEFFETDALPGAQVFSGDRPILVTQIITSMGFPGVETGDPSMVTVLPSEQYLQHYTFSTVGGNQFRDDFVSIIAQDADVFGGTILLDNAPVPAADFTPIAGTGYSYAVVAIADGAHTTSSSGVHGITVEGFDSFDSYLYAGGARFADPGTPIAAEVPAGFRLEQNYPNPFATETRIAFRLAEAGPVSLKVYDVLGREVATLVEGALPAGDHVVEWDVEDRAMPSGVYSYRLTAGGHTATSRMTLVR